MFGRETIQQVGLLCIIVGFPIAELAQSLVSTSVSFTDTFIMPCKGGYHNLIKWKLCAVIPFFFNQLFGFYWDFGFVERVVGRAP